MTRTRVEHLIEIRMVKMEQIMQGCEDPIFRQRKWLLSRP